MRNLKIFIAIFFSIFQYAQSGYANQSAEPSLKDYDKELRIVLPMRLGRVVESHINSMFRAGLFFSFADEDFNHGHIVRRAGNKEEYGSLDEFLKDAAFIVYHTDENASRWVSLRQADLPPEKRIQRSIVGYLNGKIKPAIELVGESQKNELPYYECCGTVAGDDLERARPELARYNQLVVVVFQGKKCLLFSQFAIERNELGRFSSGGMRYEIFFTLKFPREAPR